MGKHKKTREIEIKTEKVSATEREPPV
uniref:Uncharacterized protein n=1 Tax=Anguilla anguilla TaxID=7936 RepID=A0A0E9UU84_ANGAN